MSVVLAVTVSPLPAQETTVIAPEEIPAGARGWGLSVFKGTEPERFEVEFLGLLRNLAPGTDFILARLTGMGLETSGVIAGMSGSPVYFEDALAGAVSFGWNFSNEAIAGITPIAAMRALSGDLRVPADSPAAAVSIRHLLDPQDLPRDLLVAGLRRLAPPVTPNARSNLLWTSVGFGGETEALLARHLAPMAPAGSTDVAPADLVRGGAVAGVLIDGDLRMAVTGTVTERRDDEILAFGHSFMDLGSLRLPMATAEVVTILSSRSNSFKLSNVGPVIGAFVEDRAAGVAGRIGLEAPTLPMTIRLSGDTQKRYDLKLAVLPQLTPTLAATAALNAVDAGRHAGGSQSVTMRARVALTGHEPLDLERVFEGEAASFNGAIYLLSLLSFLVEHPTERVELENLEVNFDFASRLHAETLLGAHASASRVKPGETIDVHLDLRRHRGSTYRRSIPVTVPEDLTTGPYYLFVGDGSSVDALRLQIRPEEPESLREGLALLRSLHSANELVILGVAPAAGLVVGGRTMPDLPATVRSIWRAAGPSASKRVSLDIRRDLRIHLDDPMVGAQRIDLQITTGKN